MSGMLALAPEYSVQCSSKEEILDTVQSDKFRYTIHSMESTRSLSLTDAGLINYKGENVQITRGGFSSLCKILSIPNAFAHKIPFDLLQENINHLKGDFETPIKVVTRPSDGAIVNVCREKFCPIFSDSFLTYFDFPFLSDGRKTMVSTYGIQLSFAFPFEANVTPTVGDTISFGREVVLSDGGFSEPTTKLVAYRLVCSNGAVMPVVFGSYTLKRGNLTEKDAVELFYAKVDCLNYQANQFTRAFDIMWRESVFDEDLVNTVSSVQRIVNNPVLGDFTGAGEDPDPDTLKSYTIDMFGIVGYDDVRKDVAKRKAFIKNHPFAEEPPKKRVDMTYYDLYNNVTALPHRFRTDYRRVQKIEQLGGNLIQHVLSTFSEN